MKKRIKWLYLILVGLVLIVMTFLGKSYINQMTCLLYTSPSPRDA